MPTADSWGYEAAVGPCPPAGKPTPLHTPGLGRVCGRPRLFGELGQGRAAHLGPSSGLRSAAPHLGCGMGALGSSGPGEGPHPPAAPVAQECTLKVQDGKFKLQDLLVVPMQRVLKYHLLLKVSPRGPGPPPGRGVGGWRPSCLQGADGATRAGARGKRANLLPQPV